EGFQAVGQALGIVQPVHTQDNPPTVEPRSQLLRAAAHGLSFSRRRYAPIVDAYREASRVNRPLRHLPMLVRARWHMQLYYRTGTVAARAANAQQRLHTVLEVTPVARRLEP